MGGTPGGGVKRALRLLRVLLFPAIVAAVFVGVLPRIADLDQVWAAIGSLTSAQYLVLGAKARAILCGLFIAALDPTWMTFGFVLFAFEVFQVLYAIGLSLVCMVWLRRWSSGAASTTISLPRWPVIRSPCNPGSPPPVDGSLPCRAPARCPGSTCS